MHFCLRRKRFCESHSYKSALDTLPITCNLFAILSVATVRQYGKMASYESRCKQLNSPRRKNWAHWNSLRGLNFLFFFNAYVNVCTFTTDNCKTVRKNGVSYESRCTLLNSSRWKKLNLLKFIGKFQFFSMQWPC